MICSPGKEERRERLDRGVANAQWRILFPNAVLVNGETLKSDHRPLRVDIESAGAQPAQSNSRQGILKLDG